MSGAHQIWWAPVYVIYDKVNSTRKKCQQKGKLTPFTWTTECTMFTPPRPKKKKKKLGVNIVSNFSWVLQSSQEKSKTMVMHKVHYGLCENGEFTHLWLKISVFLSIQSDIKFNFYCSDLKWHSKMPLTLLGLLEPDRFKKRIFWTGTGLRSRLVFYTFNMLSLFTAGRDL